MAGMAAFLGGYQQPAGGATGKTLQAPIKGLKAAMTPEPTAPVAPTPGDDSAPDRSALGVRTPSDPITILADMLRSKGRIY